MEQGEGPPDILHHSRSKEATSVRAEQLQVSHPDIARDEDHGTVTAPPPKATDPARFRPLAVCSLGEDGHVGCHHLSAAPFFLQLGQRQQRYEDYILGLFQCLQHHPATAPQGQTVEMGVELQLVAWITDYLTGRPLYLRLGDCRSDRVACSPGVLQRTVFSPLLFILYTSDF